MQSSPARIFQNSFCRTIKTVTFPPNKILIKSKSVGPKATLQQSFELSTYCARTTHTQATVSVTL